MKTMFAIVALLCVVCISTALKTTRIQLTANNRFRSQVLAQRRLLKRLLLPSKLLFSSFFSSSNHLFHLSLKIGRLDSREQNGATNVNYNGNPLGGYGPPKAAHLKANHWEFRVMTHISSPTDLSSEGSAIRFVPVVVVPVKESVLP